MLLRNTFHKTKMFFHKTLQNLKSFLFGGYKKLPKTCPLSPLYGGNGNLNLQQLDQFNRDFSEQWQSDNDKVIKSKDISQGRRGETWSQIGNGGGGGYILAEKMRELEMMDMNDVDHVLDIEEVLHNYACLTYPVYLDIVDNFFMDMYSKFLIPNSSITITNSSRRLDPLKF
ncbi:hypothetical protein CsSME_00012399 [Camellia sinensis var. sinensis]